MTSQTRIPLIANGTIDMECGSTTNNLARSQQVDYLAISFITGTRLGSKKGSRITEIEDMDRKIIALVQGTTNEKPFKAAAEAAGISVRVVPVKDHPQAWLSVDSDRVDPALQQHLFNVTQTQIEANLQPHRVRDDLRGKPVALVAPLDDGFIDVTCVQLRAWATKRQ